MVLDALRAELPIPIILITGYLGAGKTTYLNHVLSQSSGRRLAVLVNDFGAINVDAGLIEGSVDGVVALQNGCICCSMAAGMHSAILNVLKRDEKPEAIVIEASGVANPGEIARTLSDDAMRPYASLELVVSMLDCENIDAYKPAELDLIKEQIRFSGIVMLTKMDNASAEKLATAKRLIQDTNRSAVIIEDYQKILNLDLLLGTKHANIELDNATPNENTNAQKLFRSWSYSSTEAMSEKSFQELLNGLPPETVRGKGFVYLGSYPETRFEFQMVGKSAQVQPKGSWGLQNPRTEVVFIALK